MYESVLDLALFSEWGRDSVQLVGRQPTEVQLVPWSKPHSAGTASWLQKELPGIPGSLIDQFVLRDTVELPSLSARVPLTVVSPDDFVVPGKVEPQPLLDRLMAVVRPISYVSLGHVAITPNGSDALVELSAYFDSHALGVVVWMTERGGRWVPTRYTLSWIS